MREKPLIPWIVAEESGKVAAGHCNCVAGLEESCSHGASLLWALEAVVKARDSMTVTQKGLLGSTNFSKGSAVCSFETHQLSR